MDELLNQEWMKYVLGVMLIATVAINVFVNPKPGSAWDKVVSLIERFVSFADRNGRFSFPVIQGQRKEAIEEEDKVLDK